MSKGTMAVGYIRKHEAMRLEGAVRNCNGNRN
jgi:hypothetical protein